jgi:hypothetical protein
MYKLTSLEQVQVYGPVSLEQDGFYLSPFYLTLSVDLAYNMNLHRTFAEMLAPRIRYDFI